jgi:hypothetical protein
MRGTFISIVVGALAGVLLTVAPTSHSSHADAASRQAPVDAESSATHVDGVAQDGSAPGNDASFDADFAEPN